MYRDSSEQLVVNGGKDLCQVIGTKRVKAKARPANDMLWSLETGGPAPTIFSSEYKCVQREIGFKRASVHMEREKEKD